MHKRPIPSSGGEQIQITAFPSDECTPAPSPDGKRIAYYTDTGGLWVMDLATKKTINVIRGEGFQDIISWSPDGKRLAVGYNPQPLFSGRSRSTVRCWSSLHLAGGVFGSLITHRTGNTQSSRCSLIRGTRIPGSYRCAVARPVESRLTLRQMPTRRGRPMDAGSASCHSERDRGKETSGRCS